MLKQNIIYFAIPIFKQNDKMYQIVKHFFCIHLQMKNGARVYVLYGGCIHLYMYTYVYVLFVQADINVYIAWCT